MSNTVFIETQKSDIKARLEELQTVVEESIELHDAYRVLELDPKKNYRFPTDSEFLELKERSRTRRRPLISLARAKGWKLDDPLHPGSKLSWRVEA